jgi:hypothetical protein
MNGPYETELEAVKAARVWETQGETMLSASLTMLIEACSAAGVTLGRPEREPGGDARPSRVPSGCAGSAWAGRAGYPGCRTGDEFSARQLTADARGCCLASAGVAHRGVPPSGELAARPPRSAPYSAQTTGGM